MRLIFKFDFLMSPLIDLQQMHITNKSGKINQEEILELLEKKRSLAMIAKRYHVADIAETLETYPIEKTLGLFKKSTSDVAERVFEILPIPNQIDLIALFSIKLATHYIEKMDSDDAADLLEKLQIQHPIKTQQIFKSLSPEHTEHLKELIAYEGDTAGSLMTIDFISIPENLTVKQALKRVKEANPGDNEAAYYIYIVDNKDKLVGYTTLIKLVVADDKTPVRDIRNDYPIATHLDTDQEEVANIFRKYDLVVLPVVNDDDHLEGVITIDDAVDVVVEEANEDILKLSGTTDVDGESILSGSISHSIWARLPWLFITIIGGIFASYVISFYAMSYHPNQVALALILSFVPLLMGLGGNVGNQSATLMVRGIATGEVERKSSIIHVFRESIVGLSLGIIIALVVYGAQLFLEIPALISSIVSVAIICNIFVAALIGTSLPLIFSKLDIDPAIASAPFISTALDIIGQIIYFSLVIAIFSFLH